MKLLSLKDFVPFVGTLRMFRRLREAQKGLDLAAERILEMTEILSQACSPEKLEAILIGREMDKQARLDLAKDRELNFLKSRVQKLEKEAQRNHFAQKLEAAPIVPETKEKIEQVVEDMPPLRAQTTRVQQNNAYYKIPTA
jgi:hypothetical protein